MEKSSEKIPDTSVLRKRPFDREESSKLTEHLEPPKKRQKIDNIPNLVSPQNPQISIPLLQNKSNSVPQMVVGGSVKMPDTAPPNLLGNMMVDERPIENSGVMVSPPVVENKVIRPKHTVEVVREIFTFFLFPLPKWKKWNSKKDDKLKMLMRKFERHPNKWTVIAKTMGFRRGNIEEGVKICKERYEGHLKPGIQKGDWKKEEDERIIELQEEYGNEWLKIHQEKMSNRTPSDIEERWNSTLRMIVEDARMQVTLQLGGPDALLLPSTERTVEIKVVRRRNGDPHPPQVVYSVNLSFGVKTKTDPADSLPMIPKEKRVVYRFRRPPPPPPLPPFFLSFRHLQPPLPPGYEIVSQRKYRPLTSNQRYQRKKKKKKRRRRRTPLRDNTMKDEDQQQQEEEYYPYDEDDDDEEEEEEEIIDERELREYSRSPSPETPFDEADFERYKSNPRRSTREKREEKLFILTKQEVDFFLSSPPPPPILLPPPPPPSTTTTTTTTLTQPPPPNANSNVNIEQVVVLTPPPPPPLPQQQQQQQQQRQPPEFRPLKYCVEKLLYERSFEGQGLMIAEEIYDEIEANSELGNYKVFCDRDPPLLTKRDFRSFLHELAYPNAKKPRYDDNSTATINNIGEDKDNNNDIMNEPSPPPPPPQQQQQQEQEEEEEQQEQMKNPSIIGECYRGFQGLEYFFKKSMIRIGENTQCTSIPSTMIGRLDVTGKRLVEEDRRRRRARSVEVYKKKLISFRKKVKVQSSSSNFRASDKRNRMRGGREYFDGYSDFFKNNNNNATTTKTTPKKPLEEYFEKANKILSSSRKSQYTEDLISILSMSRYDVGKSLLYIQRNQEKIKKKYEMETRRIKDYKEKNLDGLFSIPHLPPKYDWHISWAKYTHSQKILKEMIQSSKYLDNRN